MSGVDVDISVLFGYIKSIKYNLATDICIVLDGVPETSLALLPTYKGFREKLEPTGIGSPMLENIKFLTKIGSLLGKNVFVVCAPAQEADQVISSIVHIITGNVPANRRLMDLLSKKNLKDDKYLSYLSSAEITKPDFSVYDKAIVATTDSDMHQLLRFDNVFMDSSTCGKRIYNDTTPAAVHHMNPNSMIIYKAIYGDISDNVPNIDKSSLNKESIIKLLDSTITNGKILQLFIDSILNQNYDNISSSLKRFISSVDPKLFDRNLEVVMLKYYSTPLQLSFSSYKIGETISKYKLKL